MGLSYFFRLSGDCVWYEGVRLVSGRHHEICKSAKKLCFSQCGILETANYLRGNFELQVSVPRSFGFVYQREGRQTIPGGRCEGILYWQSWRDDGLTA